MALAVLIAAGIVNAMPPVTSGLVYWLDGDDLDGDGAAEGANEAGCLDGLNVTQWVDKATGYVSGDGRQNAAQAGSANYQPRLIKLSSGRNAVLFDGHNDFLRSPAFSAPLSQPLQVFAVFKNTPDIMYGKVADGAGYWFLMDGLTSSNRDAIFIGTGGSPGHITQFNLYTGGDYSEYSVEGDIPFRRAMQLTALFSGWNDSTMRTNGAAVATPEWGSGISTNALDGVTVGAPYDNAGTKYSLQGYICELLIFSTPLSETNRNAVENYLIEKWLPAPEPITGFPSDGLKLWVKADAIQGLADGQRISFWEDMSGRGNDALRNTGNDSMTGPVYKEAVLNGKPVARFSRSTMEQLKACITGFNGKMTNSVTVFTVNYYATNQPSENPGCVISIGDANASWGYCNCLSILHQSAASGNRYAQWDQATGTKLGPVLPCQQWLILARCDTTTAPYHNLWTNGVACTVEDYAQPLILPGTVQLGVYVYSGYEYYDPFNGDLAEALVFDRALSGEEIGQVENYLELKYGSGDYRGFMIRFH